jgi:hypothetical protein
VYPPENKKVTVQKVLSTVDLSSGFVTIGGLRYSSWSKKIPHDFLEHESRVPLCGIPKSGTGRPTIWTAT